MRIKQLCLLIAALILTGCVAAPKTLYHWGDYNHTLYNFTKEPSAETRDAHVNELKEIIAYANEKNKQVPPGIFYELGMMEAETGNNKAAVAYLGKELELYPEAKPLVNLARKEIGAL
ncbi:MAG: DUF4810 domain-containing protein [Shewanella sp.]|nr:DUF4810 domain-containing protein [Shewanella sp.]